MNLETVWMFMREGCNAAEIAAYSGMSLLVTRAMCARALKLARAGLEVA